MDFLAKNVRTIQAGVQHHNRTCGVPASAILLHPAEHAKLGVDELWGIPVYADERQRQRFFRVECEGSAWQIESELELYTQHPHTDPVTPPPHPETVPHTPLERPLAAWVSE